MVKKERWAPTEATKKTLFDESEKRNRNFDHYKIVHKVNMQQMSQEDCSYMIDKLREKDSYNHWINKLVSIKTREENKYITIHPEKWMNKYSESKKDKNDLIDKLFLKKWNEAVKNKNYEEAIIPYIELKDKEKFKQVINANIKNKNLQEFLTYFVKKDLEAEEFVNKIKQKLENIIL